MITTDPEPVDIPDETPPITEGDPAPAPEYRQCSTCGAPMVRAGKRAWLCPNQADQGNGVSLTVRRQAQATARAVDRSIGF